LLKPARLIVFEACRAGIAEEVNTEPITPVSWQISIEITNFTDLSIFLVQMFLFKYLAKVFKSFW